MLDSAEFKGEVDECPFSLSLGSAPGHYSIKYILWYCKKVN